jgi:predicted phage terminase large subunit-like protein
MLEEWVNENSEDWLKEAKLMLDRMPQEALLVRERCQHDLFFFAQLVNKGYVYGSIHEEIFRWMQDYSLFGIEEEDNNNKLIMLPRAHLKSHMLATWVAWIIMKHPEVTIIYLSATAELAELQLGAVQNILTSDTFRRYFPEYVNPAEGLRTKWSSRKICVDHPKRRKEGVRDNTVATAGLTTNTTGWHADIVVADDLVVPENAYTEDGRLSVSKKSSQFTSIRNTGGFTMAAGTRYHPNDIYATWKEQVFEVYDDDGLLVDRKPVWAVKEFAVEEDMVFIWPRRVRPDGKAFGFDRNSLARIKSEYEDSVQFFAQYYNNPNDPSSDRISRDKFQYINPRMLTKESGRWRYNGRKLNIYAAVDFAFSLSSKADYTAIVVVGLDSDGNYYVLDIDRFKSDKTIDYFRAISALHSKWQFKKLQAEVTVAQQVIVNSIKDYVKRDGLALSVVEYRPTRQEGRKEERIAAALEHLYDDYKVWHVEGGWTTQLEQELIEARPQHDDIKDALASAVSIAVKPAKSFGSGIKDFMSPSTSGNRFGGVSYR